MTGAEADVRSWACELVKHGGEVVAMQVARRWNGAERGRVPEGDKLVYVRAILELMVDEGELAARDCRVVGKPTRRYRRAWDDGGTTARQG